MLKACPRVVDSKINKGIGIVTRGGLVEGMTFTLPEGLYR